MDAYRREMSVVIDLSNALYPFGPSGYSRRAIVMLQSFLDAGKDKAGRFLTVAGCLSTTQAWCRFQERWQGVRERLGVEYFHMTDFMRTPTPEPYKSLSGQERYAIIDELVRLAREHEVSSVVVALNLDDFNALPPEDQALADNNPFGLAAAQLIGLIALRFEEAEFPEDIAYAFEVGGSGEAAFVQAMGGLTVQLPEVKQQLRVYSVFPVRSKREMPAMDLADVMAWVYRAAAPQWTDPIIRLGTYSDLVMRGIPCDNHLISGQVLRDWVDANRVEAPSVAYARIAGLLPSAVSVFGRVAAGTRRKRRGQ